MLEAVWDLEPALCFELVLCFELRTSQLCDWFLMLISYLTTPSGSLLLYYLSALAFSKASLTPTASLTLS
jgi:hypothetical protein